MRTEFAQQPPTPSTAAASRRDPAGSPAARAVAAVRAVTQPRQAAVDEAALKAAREQANKALAGNSRELTFELDDGSGRVVVKLIDTRTKEVLRQMPSEEMLAISRALKDGELAGALLRADA
jgi:flagellar protein FlaG